MPEVEFRLPYPALCTNRTSAIFVRLLAAIPRSVYSSPAGLAVRGAHRSLSTINVKMRIGHGMLGEPKMPVDDTTTERIAKM